VHVLIGSDLRSRIRNAETSAWIVTGRLHALYSMKVLSGGHFCTIFKIYPYYLSLPDCRPNFTLDKPFLCSPFVTFPFAANTFGATELICGFQTKCVSRYCSCPLWIQWILVPLREANGAPLGYYAASCDNFFLSSAPFSEIFCIMESYFFSHCRQRSCTY
jgi:hypothetical protein